MTDKIEGEIWLAERFAEAHNRDFNTDFTIIKPVAEADSADAYLVSQAKGIKISLQICIASSQARMREEGIQEKLQKKISGSLMKKGLEDCHILLLPGKAPEPEDLQVWHDSIVAIVAEHYSEAVPRYELKHDGFDTSPFGELPFSSITISRGVLRPEWKKWVIIDFLIVKDVLEVDSTIQGAINLKIAKNYSDAKTLWLLLQPGDGAHSIEQVELNNSKLRDVGKFNQVWWVYPQRNQKTEIYRFGQKGIV